MGDVRDSCGKIVNLSCPHEFMICGHRIQENGSEIALIAEYKVRLFEEKIVRKTIMHDGEEYEKNVKEKIYLTDWTKIYLPEKGWNPDDVQRSVTEKWAYYIELFKPEIFVQDT